jgi:hypothetical protein
VQVVATKETDPAPLCDQVTLPVGEYPVTVALQLTTFDEPTITYFGLQEIVVFVVFTVTTRLYAPAVAGLLESPPKLAVSATEEPVAVGVNLTEHAL